MRRALLSVALAMTAAAVPSAAFPVAPAPPIAVVSLSVSRFCTPAPACTANQDVTIARGGTVVWVWADALCAATYPLGCDHTVTSGDLSPDGRFDSGPMFRNGTLAYTHVFDSPGAFAYYCTLHGVSMRAQVIVT